MQHTKGLIYCPCFLFKVPASVISNTADIEEGDNVTLLCNVSGDTSSVSWASNHLIKYGATLPLPNISRNYKGNYTCIASNPCGNDSKTTFVNVKCESAHLLTVLWKSVRTHCLLPRCCIILVTVFYFEYLRDCKQNYP